ncbi:unnamed protein product [Allacma fusca]|uniref:Uncharacterized protein n=1 Tax=Allacma fusca TaxID=39272 RepID=A0A8J2P8R3_9HEXA|nr:unnamed protein product [Allacma fusca]
MSQRYKDEYHVISSSSPHLTDLVNIELEKFHSGKILELAGFILRLIRQFKDEISFVEQVDLRWIPFILRLTGNQLYSADLTENVEQDIDISCL